MENLTLK